MFGLFRKQTTQKRLIESLKKLDGTMMMVDPELRRIQNEISAHQILTTDDELKLIGLQVFLAGLIEVNNEVYATLANFIKTHKFVPVESPPESKHATREVRNDK